MFSDHLTPEARQENAMMLAAALGLQAVEAAEALEFEVAITVDPADAVASTIGNELAAILGRTIRWVRLNDGYDSASVEVVIGDADAKTHLERVYVSVAPEQAVIGGDSRPEVFCAQIPLIYTVLIACYTCAVVLQRVFRERLPFNVTDPLQLVFSQLGVDEHAISSKIDLGKTYLAGAGAIGNGFLWAARYLNLHGELHIADDDTVSSGNLNRQIWFTQDDINKSKAERLSLHAQPFFPNLKLEARQKRLQDLPEKTDGPWLMRLFVAVDSRRARRKLQNEFPGEVFDASTTDIREVVVHHHKQPTTAACLSCIYEVDREETDREAHIAEHLGVSVEEVRKERISEESAVSIAERIQGLDAASIVGMAYDTLFKQLCGQERLTTLEGRRIVAPFAFVSILAGTLLALETVRQLADGNRKKDHNYWRVSPWHAPFKRGQITRPKQPECSFCGNHILAAVNAALWGSRS